MNVTSVRSLCELDLLAGDWQAAHAEDPHAPLFLSWFWLRALFEMETRPWCVLCARPSFSSQSVAFLPLVARRALPGRRAPGAWELAGRANSGYTGFICRPGWASSAIPALAAFLQSSWHLDALHVEDVLDPRRDLFLGSFGSAQLDARHAPPRPVPFCDLTSSWEGFLEQEVSSEVRTELCRMLDELESLRVSGDDPKEVGADLPAFVSLRQNGEAPGDKDLLGHALLRAFETDRLWLRVFRRGTEPVAALAILLDRTKEISHCLLAAEHMHSGLAPRDALIAYAIRHMLSKGQRPTRLVFDGAGCHDSPLCKTQLMVSSSVLFRRGRLRRIASLLGAVGPKLDRGSGGSIPARPGGIEPGQLVRIKPLEQIEASLSSHGALDGCAFTSPMSRFCGQKARVIKRVERSFDEHALVSRRCRDVVVLELPPCDGLCHPEGRGCGRACMFFWKTSWLEPLGDAPESEPPALNNHAKPVNGAYSRNRDNECQLMLGGPGGDEPIAWRLDRIVGRGMRPLTGAFDRQLHRRKHDLLTLMPRAAGETMQRLWRSVAPKPAEQSHGSSRARECASPAQMGQVGKALWDEIQPGTRVRVRDMEEIEQLLDENKRYRGCYFMSGMQRYCGREMHVLGKVETFFDESRGKILRCRNLVTLREAYCDGTGSMLTGGCDRTCHPFWRTEWLEPAVGDVASAGGG